MHVNGLRHDRPYDLFVIATPQTVNNGFFDGMSKQARRSIPWIVYSSTHANCTYPMSYATSVDGAAEQSSLHVPLYRNLLLRHLLHHPPNPPGWNVQLWQLPKGLSITSNCGHLHACVSPSIVTRFDTQLNGAGAQ